MNAKQTPWMTIALLVGLLVRVFRLDWQPLWWDEGYSLYFATEPLSRMLWLTAHDIHPPLYYALLHGWLLLAQSTHPLAARLFSVLFGWLSFALLAWLTHLIFPRRPRLLLLVLLLLVYSPIHLFYSHEIRMYGLAVALGLFCTGSLWQLTHASGESKDERKAVWRYALGAALAIYTLYYLALLLLAHALWMAWTVRGHWRRLRGLLLADLIAFVLFLPWLLYSAPKLIRYVAAKVPSDADQPLGLLAYVGRHLLAFTAGHLETPTPELTVLRWAGVMGLVLLLVGAAWSMHRADKHPAVQSAINRLPSAPLLLWSSLLAPVSVGFLINLRLPFFPDGGERLLLFGLPYFLLLVALGIDHLWRQYRFGLLALLALLTSSAVGIGRFYTLPRASEHDYRPLIRQIIQQGGDNDTVLAIFPWEVGYWRAYAPQVACPWDKRACTAQHGLDGIAGPQMELLGEGAVVWGASVQDTLDRALASGALWFPAPLSFGSSLPGEIERYLAQRSVNLENRWYSPTTRLSAWRALPPVTLHPVQADFGAVQVVETGVAPATAVSANQPIHIALAWQGVQQGNELAVTLRLTSPDGQVWANRDYGAPGSLSSAVTSTAVIDQVGLLVSAGLPPDRYAVMLGVVQRASGDLLTLKNGAANPTYLLPIGSVEVTLPNPPPPAFRLPIPHITPAASVVDGVALLGYAGNWLEGRLLAGAEVELTLFWRAQQPNLMDRQLYVGLLDDQGAELAGWTGWSPPNWRSSQWGVGTLVRAPVGFFTPATLTSGDYRLIAGLLDPATGKKGASTMLKQVNIYQRPAQWTEPSMSTRLAEPLQLGTHVQLLGYTLVRQNDALEVALVWRVLQTLLPPHQLFVHLDAPDGATLAQDDGAPQTAAGPAPSGSWRPDEYLTTHHHISWAGDLTHNVLRVGLYLPTTGARLPVSANGQSIGDAVVIPLEPV
jgi:hypothetical protein